MTLERYFSCALNPQVFILTFDQLTPVVKGLPQHQANYLRALVAELMLWHDVWIGCTYAVGFAPAAYFVHPKYANTPNRVLNILYQLDQAEMVSVIRDRECIKIAFAHRVIEAVSNVDLGDL